MCPEEALAPVSPRAGDEGGPASFPTRGVVSPDILPTRRFGPFVLMDRIASGGMAEIYRALYTPPDGREQVVALKLILPHYNDDDELIEMLRDEARITRHIHHENLARVIGFGEVRGKHYLAIEYIWGKDLRAVLKRSRQRREYLPVEHVCYVMASALAGLHSAHEQTDDQGRPLHVIHRDVSPSNIVIPYEGPVKVIDFGIAKAAFSKVRTRIGIVKGKVRYMSPEQTEGRKLDPRSDVFSAGTVLYEALTLRLPFSAPTESEMMDLIRYQDPILPSKLDPAIPPELDRILAKAMAKKRSARFQTALEFSLALRELLESKYPGYRPQWLGEYVSELFAQEKAAEEARFRDYERSLASLDRSDETTDAEKTAAFQRPGLIARLVAWLRRGPQRRSPTSSPAPTPTPQGAADRPQPHEKTVEDLIRERADADTGPIAAAPPPERAERFPWHAADISPGGMEHAPGFLPVVVPVPRAVTPNRVVASVGGEDRLVRPGSDEVATSADPVPELEQPPARAKTEPIAELLPREPVGSGVGSTVPEALPSGSLDHVPPVTPAPASPHDATGLSIMATVSLAAPLPPELEEMERKGAQQMVSRMIDARRLARAEVEAVVEAQTQVVSPEPDDEVDEDDEPTMVSLQSMPLAPRTPEPPGGDEDDEDDEDTRPTSGQAAGGREPQGNEGQRRDLTGADGDRDELGDTTPDRDAGRLGAKQAESKGAISLDFDPDWSLATILGDVDSAEAGDGHREEG